MAHNSTALVLLNNATWTHGITLSPQRWRNKNATTYTLIIFIHQSVTSPLLSIAVFTRRRMVSTICRPYAYAKLFHSNGLCRSKVAGTRFNVPPVESRVRENDCQHVAQHKQHVTPQRRFLRAALKRKTILRRIKYAVAISYAAIDVSEPHPQSTTKTILHVRHSRRSFHNHVEWIICAGMCRRFLAPQQIAPICRRCPCVSIARARIM